MQGLSSLVVCALVALCAAQTNSQSGNQLPPTPTPPAGPNMFPLNSQASPAPTPAIVFPPAVVAQWQMQQNYASLILEYQSTVGWMQVAQGWMQMIHEEAKESGTATVSLEEEEMTPFMGTNLGGGNADIERQTENVLLHVIKIMYLQTAKQLGQAQDAHYTLRNAIASNPAVAQQFSSSLSLMYYIDILRTLSSAYAIQRQDAWNTWIIHEMIETEAFSDDIPEEFQRTLIKSQQAAMAAYYMEASNDFQIMLLEYYLMIMYAQMVPPTSYSAGGLPPSSFLEEEATAQPNKPFLPFMMMGAMGGMNPQTIAYYVMMMKYWRTMLNFQAAQGLYQFATMEAESLDGKDIDSKLSTQVQTYAVSALQQWAYISLMLVMFDFQAVQSGGFISHNNNHAAVAHALLQTEVPESLKVPQVEASPEQKAAMDKLIAQFLHPQPIMAQQQAAQ